MNVPVYDRELFLQLIESYQGIKYLRNDNLDDISAQFYEGLTGKCVMIDITDLSDDILYSEGVGYLTELGLSYLIPRLFPPIEDLTEDQVAAWQTHEELKEIALKGV